MALAAAILDLSLEEKMVGVFSQAGRWSARLTVTLGTYDDEEEAKRVRDEATWTLNGENAIMNFPYDVRMTQGERAGTMIERLREFERTFGAPGAPREEMIRLQATYEFLHARDDSNDAAAVICNATSEDRDKALRSKISQLEQRIQELQQQSPHQQSPPDHMQQLQVPQPEMQQRPEDMPPGQLLDDPLPPGQSFDDFFEE